METAISSTTLFERQCALRAILMNPLFCMDSEKLLLIKRHVAWLREWLSKYPGWTIHVSSEFARLHKTPAFPVSGMYPARDTTHGTPFTRHRYVLLCLALAALEKSESQGAVCLPLTGGGGGGGTWLKERARTPSRPMPKQAAATVSHRLRLG